MRFLWITVHYDRKNIRLTHFLARYRYLAQPLLQDPIPVQYNISKMEEVHAIDLEFINQAFGTDFTDPEIARVFFETWAEAQQTIPQRSKEILHLNYLSNPNRDK